MNVRALAITGALLWSAVASADGKLAREKLADREFAAAKRLVAAGKFAQACERFQASLAADPALGTLLNLADCHDKLGRTATAVSEFRSALERALAAKDDRAGFARERIAALEPRLTKLVIEAPVAVPGLAVTRDGTAVTLGDELEVDPGSYHIEATAAGYTAWSESVTLAEAGATKHVEVPELSRLEVSTSSSPKREAWSGHDRRVAAIGVTVVAALCATTAIGFGVSAHSHYVDSEAAVTQAPLQAAYDIANSQYHFALGFGITSLALGGAAVYLWRSSRQDADPTATRVTGFVGPGVSGVAFKGTF